MSSPGEAKDGTSRRRAMPAADSQARHAGHRDKEAAA
jgi:hypothetical protein